MFCSSSIIVITTPPRSTKLTIYWSKCCQMNENAMMNKLILGETSNKIMITEKSTHLKSSCDHCRFDVTSKMITLIA